MQKTNKQAAFLLFCVMFFGVGSAFPRSNDAPKPEPESTEVESAAAGAVKGYSLVMANEYKSAAEKLRSGEFRNLDEANKAMSESIPLLRKAAFKHLGELIDRVPDGDAESAAKAMSESAIGFERAAYAIK